MNEKTVMVALGGNALSPRGAGIDIYKQFSRTRKSLTAIMHFVEEGYNICITHGNGPQVGAELLRNDLTAEDIPSLPLGICVAETQGSIGYMVQQSLQNQLKTAEIDREVVTLVTQVVVDADDPSILSPSKFIGQTYTKEKANLFVERFNWTIAEQNPGEWRRVVPSPIPQYIMHGTSVKALVDRGTIVLAAGGGGIPTYYDENADLQGLDGVIDKDYAAALMGRIIRSSELWIITDVDNAYLNFNTPEQEPISTINSKLAQKYLDQGHFSKGSMAPKIEAAIYFLRHHGQRVIITSIEKINDALDGNAGTVIVKE